MKQKIVIIIFTLFYITFSLFTYKSYGITGDEPYAYFHGKALLLYLQGHEHQSIALLTRVNNDNVLGYFNAYDGAYSLVLNLLNVSASIDRFHLLNLLFGGLLFLAAYSICFRYYKNQFLAVIFPIFLFLTPRLLGEIPGNPKDVPFATLYFLSLCAILLLKNSKKEIVKIIILGLLFGIAETMRIAGVTLYIILFCFDIYTDYMTKKIINKKTLLQFLYKECLSVLLIVIVSTFILTITWPYIGENFFVHFREEISSAKNFKLWDGTVLLFGHAYSTLERPWYYLPVWILITTPVFILAFFFSSIIFIKNKLQNDIFILFTFAIVINLSIYVYVHPVIYSGLRHFLFLLPLIVGIAAISCIEFIKYTKFYYVKIPILIFTVINIVVLISNLIYLHPYEYIYFNEAIGGVKGAQGNFEIDYWGASYREATKWLITNKLTDKTKSYKISMCLPPFHAQYYFQSNMKWVPPQQSEYFLCHADSWWNQVTTERKIIHVITRNGVPLTYIFKLQ